MFSLVACVLLAVMSSPPFCVIDLAGGSKATNYPVSYLMAAPTTEELEIYKTDKLLLRRIEPGTFTMTDGTKTYSNVRISQPFYVGVFEVTQRQWELVTGGRPAAFGNGTYYPKRPIESVAYDVVMRDFVSAVRQRAQVELDLPTEAQWEYACRAGSTNDYNCVTNDLSKIGRHRDNGGAEGYNNYSNATLAAGTAAVGSYLPNAWGLYDFHGNVQEMCRDWYATLQSNITDPTGLYDYGTYRVVRGGYWYLAATGIKSSARGKARPGSTYASAYTGFRVTLPNVEVDFSDIATAVDCESLAFENDETAPWVVEFGVAQGGGVSSARSGQIARKSSTSLTVHVSGSGTFSFWWRASSEYDEEYDDLCDFGSFTADGKPIAQIGGFTPWHFVSLKLGAGEHTLVWTYEKDKNGDEGEDCIWIDRVSWRRPLAIYLN